MLKTKPVSTVVWLAAILVAVGGAPAAAQAPASAAVKPESLVGVWEGAAQSANGEVPLRAEFTYQDGKLGGAIDSSMGRIVITGATLADDKLTMGIDLQGTAGALGGKVHGSRIEGVWEMGGQSGAFALAKSGTAASDSPAGSPGGDPISGEWAGEVMIGGQAMPFSMVLRLSGETVGGEMTSAMGKVPLASGAWKDGTLLLTFPYVGGEPVGMGAQLQEGKLVGVVDYNRGEATGTWTASKKQ